jgi:phosphoethanolamine N-methyltransferase
MSSTDPAKPGPLSEPGEYDPAMLELLQLLWGDGFLSPGGGEELERLFESSDIRHCAVLDIGCGLGAVDELLVTRFGARTVVGVDIDPALVAATQRRVERAGLSSRIRSVRVNGGTLPFDAASFDVVFSKDSMVQIPDKPSIYADVLRLLRPGGRFIASDWLRGGTGNYSPDMMEFFRLEGITYNMVTLEQSASALAAAGFVDVEIRDRHAWYLDLAQQELAALEGPLMQVVESRIGAERARHFVNNWRQLVVVVKAGELRPGHLKAAKPRGN